MLKRRVVSDDERAAAEAVQRAYEQSVKSECRPGIRGRCGIPGCPRCDPPEPAEKD